MDGQHPWVVVRQPPQTFHVGTLVQAWGALGEVGVEGVHPAVDDIRPLVGVVGDQEAGAVQGDQGVQGVGVAAAATAPPAAAAAAAAVVDDDDVGWVGVVGQLLDLGVTQHARDHLAGAGEVALAAHGWMQSRRLVGE